MNVHKNKEILITGRFIGVADNGKIQVKIKGINNVQFNIDANYISAAGKSPRSPAELNTKTITHHPEYEPEYADERFHPKHKFKSMVCFQTDLQKIKKTQGI